MGEKLQRSLLETRYDRWLKRGSLGVGLVVVLLCLSVERSQALPLVGTDGTKIYKFDSATPGTVTTVTLTGLIPGDSLIGIDYHPVTGQLYGIGNGRIYVVNGANGAASSVGGTNPDFAPSGGTFGTDISPLDDQVVRIVSNTHQNIRVSLSDATVVSTDTSLSYTGNPSNIAAISYSNGFRYASTTTCFGIGALDGRLLRIGSNNGSPTGAESGVVTKLGLLGPGLTSLNQNIGFDIAPDGTAYAAIVFGGQLRLYAINLNTGAATLVGPIAGGATSFRGLAAETGRKVFSNPALIRIPRVGLKDQNIHGVADPYPSGISVSGLSGVVTDVHVSINDFRLKEPRQISMLLASPDGMRRLNFWAGAGSNFSTCGSNCDNNTNPGSGGAFVTLSDSGIVFMPNDNPVSSFDLYKPTNNHYDQVFVGEWGGTQFFPPPAPGPPYAYAGPFGTSTFLSAFYGTTPMAVGVSM